MWDFDGMKELLVIDKGTQERDCIILAHETTLGEILSLVAEDKDENFLVRAQHKL